MAHLNERQGKILVALQDLGGRATARAVAAKAGLDKGGVCRSLNSQVFDDIIRRVRGSGYGADAVYEFVPKNDKRHPEEQLDLPLGGEK